MDRKTLDDTSKFLSYVLRHQPEAIGLTLDGEGWADIDALIAGAARDGRALDRVLLGAVVENNDKKRFALSADGQRIRAVQGHSHAAVAIAYAPAVPPAVLYHGTARRFLDSIRERGLVPGSRHHVHLSARRATALEVGRRYGSPVLLEIDARDMHLAGHLFHQAENGVWLTERVPVRFIREA
ncbi:RNA 2'-phosphotransferase [Pseudomonas aeruginosa]|nr:RNA 2'-phosphotransferase [Pseudomonas aeruginosa]